MSIGREINPLDRGEERLATRRLRSATLVATLEEWLHAERAKLSPHNVVAKAIDYMLTRWPAFSRLLEDGPSVLRTTWRKERRAVWPWKKVMALPGSERRAERAAGLCQRYVLRFGGNIRWRVTISFARQQFPACDHPAGALSRRIGLAVPLAGPIARRMRKISYSGYRFPPEIIQQAIWLYLRFTPSKICWRSVEWPCLTRPFGVG